MIFFILNFQDFEEAYSVLQDFEKELDKNILILESNNNEKALVEELHRYNDIKDMSQSLIGSLATLKGVTSSLIHQEFDVINI